MWDRATTVRKKGDRPTDRAVGRPWPRDDDGGTADEGVARRERASHHSADLPAYQA